MDNKTHINSNKYIGNLVAGICLILVIYCLDQNIEGVIIWLIIFGFIAILYSIWEYAKVSSEKIKEMKGNDDMQLSKLDNFNSTNKFQDEYGLLLAIDDVNMKIAIKTKKISLKTYDYSDILECEIIENDTSVYKKSTTRTVGGAVLGGILAGGAGAIVGGLSGKQKKDKKYQKIQLKLTLKDTSNPNIFLLFFDVDVVTINTKKDVSEEDGFPYGAILKTARENVNEWRDIFVIIIDKMDSLSKSSSNNSLADELLKLNKLKEQGILSEVEFTEQKKKLLEQ